MLQSEVTAKNYDNLTKVRWASDNEYSANSQTWPLRDKTNKQTRQQTHSASLYCCSAAASAVYVNRIAQTRVRGNVQEVTIQLVSFDGRKGMMKLAARGTENSCTWRLCVGMNYEFVSLGQETLVNWDIIIKIVTEKLIVTQLVKSFPTLYGTRRLITTITRARHWTLH
jgi:hypothetical protein